MKAFSSNDPHPDPEVLEQAMLWMVRLQSGVSTEAEQHACQRWRQESPAHELAWRRLEGIGQGLRDGTRGFCPAGARGLLNARTLTSRRAVLKGLAGVGVVVASGYGVQQRSLLPTLFSDYGTGTGERRNVALETGLALQLDTRTALDSQLVSGIRELTLNSGRVSLKVEQGAMVSLHTADAAIHPGELAQLIVSRDRAGTQVQLLQGSALVAQAQGRRFTLQAGWQQRFSDGHISAPSPLPAGAGAWTQGLLVAERLSLGQLLAELDRYRPGVLRCDPRIAGMLVSGSFSVDQPEASLDLLAQVLPIRVQRVFGYWANVVPA
ncbi:DUF4880 domain-containing protein [Pseudomonas sp. GD03860]|uniref:DUF4880 domain-containing protein n=1 Tax=Pseudomonas TaxID=286 RepID=UPI0023634C20|nr:MULTISPECIES: DUF4880 domain-containing protein [Pseudomonas]MDD2056475.1 DUF4880 domain-containing protein [Pseudomonas putida]MDH0638826.1 DUF4880 domain-containing protein [Pseudomonas sp. GD03860]